MGARNTPADQSARPADKESIEEIRRQTQKAREEQQHAEVAAKKAKEQAEEARLERDRERTATAREVATATVPQAQSKRGRKLRDLRTSDTANMSRDATERALKSIREHNATFDRKGTTPRDLAENRPDFWTAPPEIRPHIEVIFISDIMFQRRAGLSGFPFHIWQPVTREIIELYGLEFRTTDTKPNGQPVYSMDMAAYWTTRTLYDDWKATTKALAAPYDGHKDVRTAVQNRFSEGVDVIGSDDEVSVGQGETAFFGEGGHAETVDARRMGGIGGRGRSLTLNRPEETMTEEEIRAKRASEREAAR